MVRAKKIFMRLLLVVEMAAFGRLYLFGNNGIAALHSQRIVVSDLQKNITLLKDDVDKLESEIYAWQTDDFYKEKVAREQLQMARKGDELFYVGT